MQNVEAPQTEAATFTVIVDPTAAISIISEYADYSEAFARFQREWLRIKDKGGAVYLYDGKTLQMENNSRGVR